MSITPLQVDLTDHATLDAWRSALAGGRDERTGSVPGARSPACSRLTASSRRRVAPAAPGRFPLRLERLRRRARFPGARRWQAPVRQAAEDASRRAVWGLPGRPSSPAHGGAPAGWRAARDARARGARRRARHAFVDAALNQAYEDTSLPIGHGQTISEAIGRRSRSNCCCRSDGPLGGSPGRVPGDRQRLRLPGGALLARLGQRVTSIERVRALYDRCASTCSSSQRDARAPAPR